MSSKRRQVKLLTAEEVKLLRPRIHEMLDAGSYKRKRSLAVDGSRALFAAWAASAAQCGDTSQLRLITDWLKAIDWEPEAADTSIRAAIQLAGDDPKLRARLYPLEGTMSYPIIGPLIAWLEPDRPAERKVLEKLCRNHHRHIAKEARDRLAAADAIPWWHGYFDHDPAAGLDDDAVASLQPKFTRYMELIDADKNEHADEVFTLVQQLPPRAKAGACLRLIRQWGWYGQFLGPVLGELLTVEGGARMLCDLVRNEHQEYGFDVTEGLGKLPPTTTSEQRAGVAREILSRLANTTEKEMDDVEGLASTYARMLSITWPDDHDPTPVLDFLVEQADPDAEKPSYSVGYWNSMVGRLDPSWLPLLKERFEEALAADFVGRFSVLGPSLEPVTDQFPESEQRRMALEVLGRPNAKHSVKWAVQILARIDSSEILNRLDDPRVRKHAFSLNSTEIFIRGRREMREGKLSPREVSRVLHRIASIFGGLVDHTERWRRGLPEFDGLDEKDSALQESITAAAPELAGPVTEEEWALVRRIRAELSASDLRDIGLAFDVPEGPWEPEDLAWVERLVDYVCAEDPHGAYLAASVCAKHPCPEVLPLLEKLEAIPQEKTYIRVGAIGDEVRKALGLRTKYDEDGEELDEDEGGDGFDPDGTDDDW